MLHMAKLVATLHSVRSKLEHNLREAFWQGANWRLMMLSHVLYYPLESKMSPRVTRPASHKCLWYPCLQGPTPAPLLWSKCNIHKGSERGAAQISKRYGITLFFYGLLCQAVICPMKAQFFPLVWWCWVLPTRNNPLWCFVFFSKRSASFCIGLCITMCVHLP